MKIRISRPILLKALQSVIGAVDARSTLPILKNALFTAEGDTLTLTATDLEIELVTHTTQVTIDTPGRTSIPAKKLLDIVKTLPDDADLTIFTEPDKGNAILTQGKRRFTFSTLSASDYPNLSDFETKQQITLPANDIHSMMVATAFSMANQDVRYYLNGMLLETTKTTLLVVSTDGHRLSINKTPIDSSGSETSSVILPRKTVMELLKLLSGKTDPVTVSFGHNHTRWVLPELTITSKLIDGKYPDWRRVVPKEHPTTVTISREAFKGACSRAAILSNEKMRGIRLSFSNDTVIVFASNPEHEQSEETVETVGDLRGQTIEIGFNVNYLLDVLNTVPSENIVIQLLDNHSSAMVFGEGQADARYVLMPMRL